MVSVLRKDTFQEYTLDANVETDFMVEDVRIVSYIFRYQDLCYSSKDILSQLSQQCFKNAKNISR